jgi:hypothetical protein
MNDIPIRFSNGNAKSTVASKRKQAPVNNLFHNHQGNLLKSPDGTLPIIALTLSSRSNFKQKIIRMASNNKSPRLTNHSPTDFRMTQIKSHVRNLNRSNASSIPKSFNHPANITRITQQQQPQQQQNPRCLYVLKTATSFQRTVSARIPNQPVSVLQQQQASAPRPYNQYEHFLAYLRRQSLARQRRKQQEEEGHNDHVETTITLNLNKQSSTHTFQSTSHNSIASLITDLTPVPSISITAKPANRLPSSHRPLHRSISTYPQIPTPICKTPTPTSKTPIDDQMYTSSSVLVTPRNSVADDPAMPPMAKSHEFHLNEDMLSYSYINDESEIKYQGHLLSMAV